MRDLFLSMIYYDRPLVPSLTSGKPELILSGILCDQKNTAAVLLHQFQDNARKALLNMK